MKKILVIGDSCIDEFIYGKSDRLCPEAPVPIFIPTKIISNGGMALNVFENIQSIYKDVEIITNKIKTKKTRYVEEWNNHMFIRVDSEKNKTARIDFLDKINLSDYSIIIISDYDKGFLLKEDIKYICDNHNSVLIDTKKILGDYCINALFIKINESECNKNKLAYVDIDDFEHNLIVTLGNKGCRYKEKIYPVDSVTIKDLSGAGDTFISALTVKYLETKDISESIKFANMCSTIIVQQKGVNKIGDHL
jgi:bifunctional ADP-heptose synthase (sugar kinase/adenylyltransferase)